MHKLNYSDAVAACSACPIRASVSRRHALRAISSPAIARAQTGPASVKTDPAYRLLERLTNHVGCDGSTNEASPCCASSSLLDSLYDELDDTIFYSKGGHVIPPAEKAAIDATGGSATYGEILSEGIDQLVKYMCLDSSSIFCDLGCGRGRTVLQVALHTNVKKALGFELSSSRLEQAEMALQQIHQQGERLRPVEFEQADLASCSLEEGSHFYLCSTAFSAGICRSIAERLAASPNFQVLVASRALPTQPYLYKLGEGSCQYSFTLKGRCFVYVKSLTTAPVSVLRRFLCWQGAAALPGMRPLQLGVSVDEPVGSQAGAAEYITLNTVKE